MRYRNGAPRWIRELQKHSPPFPPQLSLAGEPTAGFTGRHRGHSHRAAWGTEGISALAQRRGQSHTWSKRVSPSQAVTDSPIPLQLSVASSSSRQGQPTLLRGRGGAEARSPLSSTAPCPQDTHIPAAHREAQDHSLSPPQTPSPHLGLACGPGRQPAPRHSPPLSIPVHPTPPQAPLKPSPRSFSVSLSSRT